MVRKPARMYREVKSQAYTRREYMGGVPPWKITQFDLGDLNKEFDIALTLLAGERCQIRDIALESARISANKYIEQKAGVGGYHLKIKVQPFIVLRENKQATGAGADRISQGMRDAFGKAVGSAARVKEGQEILTLEVNKENFNDAKEALRRARMKLPTPCKVIITKGKELVK